MNGYFEFIGAWHGGGILRAYLIGFALSLACTIGAYVLVLQHHVPASALFAMIFALAFAQLLVQLVCFLHLGSDISVRMRVIATLATMGIIGILVAGSLWIMDTLNARMMNQGSQVEYMQNQTGM